MSVEATRENILRAVSAFPAISPAAGKVLSLLNDPQTNVSTIEAAIRYDPGLTANILRLANSAYFGLPGKIASIAQAVTQLGWKRMYQLVIASSINALMDRSVPGYQLSRGELWRHSVAVGVASETLIRQRKLKASDEIFTAALLHDVGKLVLGEFLSADLDLIDVAASRGVSFTGAEREVLGTDHAEVGAWVLESWSLPGPIVEATRWHHEPAKNPKPNGATDIVHVADALCLMLGIGIGHEGLQYNLDAAVMQRLGLHAAHLEAAGAETHDAVEELARTLHPAEA